MTELGTLVEVNVRSAWENEPRGFTQWLKDNLDRLSEKLDLRLEFEGIEVRVGRFAADIVARNLNDDTRVLIENQLEIADHNHLGQILTYLAGLDAKTIIWVAPIFREEHLSALRWLNEHTIDPFAFFAVQVRVVRIGDSLPAPVFEVLERPNNWDRQVQQVAQTKMGAYAGRRRAFWARYLELFPEQTEYGPANGATSRWHVFNEYGIVLSLFLAKDAVGLFIRGLHGAEPAATALTLAPHRQTLESQTESTEWDEKSGYFFTKRLPGDTQEASNLDEMTGWLHQNVQRYTRALHDCFGAQA